MVKIYGLVCPKSGQIRYIGKTVRDLQVRLYGHITESRSAKTSHKQRWIAKCFAEGLRPTVWLLEEVPPCIRWQDRERAWIAKALELGFDLTNQTAGGEGLEFLDPEAKAAYAKKISANSKARYQTDEKMRVALIAGTKRSWAENRQKRIDACQSGWTEESRKAHQLKMAELRNTPEFRAARKRGQKQAWVTSREVFVKAFSNPQCKANQSESKKRTWADPDARARMMNRWTPEARQRQSEQIRARMARMVPTPEGRERQRQAMRDYWAKRRESAK